MQIPDKIAPPQTATWDDIHFQIYMTGIAGLVAYAWLAGDNAGAMLENHLIETVRTIPHRMRGRILAADTAFDGEDKPLFLGLWTDGDVRFSALLEIFQLADSDGKADILIALIETNPEEDIFAFLRSMNGMGELRTLDLADRLRLVFQNPDKKIPRPRMVEQIKLYLRDYEAAELIGLLLQGFSKDQITAFLNAGVVAPGGPNRALRAMIDQDDLNIIEKHFGLTITQPPQGANTRSYP